MGERHDARGSIESARDRMTDIVEELARRATPAYVGERIKEATVNKTRELGERASGSTAALAIVGGAIGAIAGTLVARSRSGYSNGEEEYSFRRGTTRDSFGRYTSRELVEAEGEEGGEGIAAKAKEKLKGVGEYSSETFSGVKDRAVDMGGRARGWLSRAWDEQPLLLSAGGLILGALAAVLAPVPERERRLVEPARRKAAEGIQKLGDKIEDTIGSAMGTESKEGGSEKTESGSAAGIGGGGTTGERAGIGSVAPVATGRGVDADNPPSIH